MRFVPLYVRFGDETYRDYVELGPDEFFEKLRASTVLPATSQPTPQDFLAAYEELAGYERIYSIHVSSKLSGTYQSAELAAQRARRRQGARRRLAARPPSRSRCSRTRSSAASRAGRPTRRSTRSSSASTATAASSSPSRRSSTCRRAGASGGRRRSRARCSTSGRSSRSRTARSSPSRACAGGQKALAEFERRFADATEDKAGLRVAIAHADAPEWVGTLSELVWRVRPKAEIEFTANLGAVVSTHAGPGAVGFFWFQDD